MGLSLRELMLLEVKSTADTAAIERTNAAIAKTGLAAAASSLKLFGLSHVFQSAGRALQMYGIAVTGVTVLTGKMGMNFEHDMAVVRTQTDYTAKEFSKVKEAILDVAASSERPLGELQEGMFDIFSTIDTNIPGAVRALKLFSRAATAGNADIRTVSRSAIAMLNSFGMGINKVNKVLDIQFQLVRYGAGTYEEIASAIGMVLPSAAAAGQTLKTTAGVLAFLTRNGLSASEAVTSAARAMDLITRPEIRENLIKTLGIDVVDKATGKFKQIDDIMYEMATKGGLAELSEPKRARIFEKIFGVGEIRANRFFKLAIPRFDELNGLIENTSKAGGAMGRAFDIVNKSAGVQFAKLMNLVRVVLVELGAAAIPVMKDLIQLGKSFVKWFRDLDPEVKNLIARGIALSGAFALVAGTVLKVAGNFMMIVSIMKLANIGFLLTAGSIAAVLAVVAALAVAAFLIIKNWDEVGPFLKETWETVKDVAVETWERVKEVISTVIDWINTNIVPVIESVVGFIIEKWNEVSAWTRDRWDEIQETIDIVLEKARNFIDYFIKYIWPIWSAFWKGILEAVRIVWELIKSIISAGIKFVQGILDIVMGIIRGDWEQIWHGIMEIVGSVWELIKGLVRTAIDSVKNIIVTAMRGLREVWDLIWDHIKSSFFTVWDAIVAGLVWAVNKMIDILNWFVDRANNVIGGLDIIFGPTFNFGEIPHIPHIPTPGSVGGGETGGQAPTTGTGHPLPRPVAITVYPQKSVLDERELMREVNWALTTSGW